MKTFKLILIFSFIIKISTGQGDFECHTPFESVTLKSTSCSDWNNYEPVDPYDTPAKSVRITFHIIQKADGTGNFPDNSTSRNWLENTYMNSLNSKFTNLQQMNLSTSSPVITDCRVRFTLANIYFWQDDYGWSYQQTAGFGNYLYSKFVVNQSSVLNKYSSVHVFMSEDDAGHGRASGIGDKKWITLSGVYHKYLANHWSPAALLAHELGHSIGLNHTWYGDECDDTPNNPNCWNVNEPPGCSNPSNNLMDYNACGCALTICQVNRAHNFLLGNGGNIGDCLTGTVSVQNPTLNGSELVCTPGETYTVEDLQLGVTVNWSVSPSSYFQNSIGCGNIVTFQPSSSSVSGEGQISFKFDWEDFGNRTITNDVWVGKASQLELCELNSPIYNSEVITIPGSSCQPMSAIIESGTSVLLIGDEIILNGGFEVELGGTLEVTTTGGCE